MKQSLSINQQQKLIMTPRLKQAINLLQLSAYDLQALVESEYMENPVLDMEAAEVSMAEHSAIEESFKQTAALAEYFDKDGEAPQPQANDELPEHQFREDGLTLEEVLLDQLTYTEGQQDLLPSAKYIVGLLDNRGYLPNSLTELTKLMGVAEEKVEAAIALVQSLEPAGVGARNLAECLAIQAKRQGIYQGLLKNVIDKYLPMIAEGKLKEIAEAEHIEPSQVQIVVDEIKRRFNPKPGMVYGKEALEYIIPDVTVKDINGKLEIFLNERAMPRLQINSLYSQQESLDADSKKYLEEKFNAAMWLIKSIEQRRLTMLKVVEEIIKQQQDVFYQGFEALKPLQMKTVAANIDVHESTVSRTVANKYMQMAYGIVPLKRFFVAATASQDGGEEVAVDKVKVALKALLEGEDKTKPLSDQKLTTLLQAQNFDISRRTVMKYREQLGYLASSKRKRY